MRVENFPPPKGYHEVHVGPLPLDKLALLIRLANGATWQCSLVPVFQDRLAYYEEHGWYEDAEDARERGGRDLQRYGQPKGRKLRRLLLANEDWDSAVNECPWRKIKPKAKHAEGPETEPPDDQLWAVQEQGGTWEIFTTLTQEAQYRMPHFWRDKP